MQRRVTVDLSISTDREKVPGDIQYMFRGDLSQLWYIYYVEVDLPQKRKSYLAS